MSHIITWTRPPSTCDTEQTKTPGRYCQQNLLVHPPRRETRTFPTYPAQAPPKPFPPRHPAAQAPPRPLPRRHPHDYGAPYRLTACTTTLSDSLHGARACMYNHTGCAVRLTNLPTLGEHNCGRRTAHTWRLAPLHTHELTDGLVTQSLLTQKWT